MRLIESLGTTEPLAEVFSDRSVLQAMLDFEAALAFAEARHKIISRSAAAAIAQAARAANFDSVALAAASAHSANPAIPLVAALTEFVRRKNRAAASFVHWGATSQDVCDTALMLLVKKARPVLETDLLRLRKGLLRLSQQNRRTVMLARTLLQPAPPITLGLKAAGWLAAVHRSHVRLERDFKEALMLQFGGASGTLAALGGHGVAVGRSIAEKLQLEYPEAPWHTHRDRLAALLCGCGVLAGTLGKMARDVTLLMQSEVGEVSEARGQGGGSSTMPHKHNPAGCVVTLAAVSRLPGLISSFLSGMIQEHERATGAWQAEWLIVSEVMQSTGRAVASMAAITEKLSVDPVRMRKNIEATCGVVFAERAMVLLGRKLGRDAAYDIVRQAANLSREKKQSLSQVLGQMEKVKGVLDRAALSDLETPEQYLGSADEFQERLLSSSAPERKRATTKQKLTADLRRSKPETH